MTAKRKAAFVVVKRALYSDLPRLVSRLDEENIAYRASEVGETTKGEPIWEIKVRRPLIEAARAALTRRGHFNGCAPC
jgi:hypothetical protein